MPDAVRRAIERFPESAEAIANLAGESEAFRSICEDYDLGLATLRRFESQLGDNRQRIAEYRTLLLELEREIERALATAGRPIDP
ncbi:hypothetical protein [Inquilinus sp. CAU 1745]|uniref:hypothetical protein n=1 Tax=Inquilinus sp. CAU 1745 TaxID=3140369 RepID=UPI00325A77C8